MISINFTLVVQLVNLLVLIWIMNRLMYRPIRRIMAERAETLAAGKAAANTLAQKAEDRNNKYQAELAAARAAVRERVNQLKIEASKAGQVVLAEAQSKAKDQHEKMASQISAEVEKAKVEVRAEAGKIARSMAAAILGRGV